jgi:ribonuclease HII
MGTLIGVDEAGRGPVIGPMVIAGFKLESDAQNKEILELGVRDSKKIAPKKRTWLAYELQKKYTFKLKVISAVEIDKQREHKTLNELEGSWFADVINRLDPDVDTTIFVDSADANENTFKRYIESKIDVKCNIISKHKADEDYPVVAAASILAKTERDSLVKTIATELNAEVGSGYPSDPITIKFLEKWIKEKGDLPPHTRHSWKTAHRLLEANRRPLKSLDDFTN